MSPKNSQQYRLPRKEAPAEAARPPHRTPMAAPRGRPKRVWN